VSQRLRDLVRNRNGSSARNKSSHYKIYRSEHELPYDANEFNLAIQASIKHFGSRETMMAEVAKTSGVPLTSSGKMVPCKENVEVIANWCGLTKTKARNEQHLDWLAAHTKSQL